MKSGRGTRPLPLRLGGLRFNVYDGGWIRFAYPPSVRERVQPLIASAETCSEAIAHCKQDGSRHPDADAKCTAAGQSCMKSGIFIGPYTNKVWRGFVKAFK